MVTDGYPTETDLVSGPDTLTTVCSHEVYIYIYMLYTARLDTYTLKDKSRLYRLAFLAVLVTICMFMNVLVRLILKKYH